MAIVTGKTVYILGAGASFHTDAPLLNNFLVTARMWADKIPEKLVYKNSFDNTFTWMDQLRSSSYYIDFNLDNLEHLFSLADMEKQIGLENGQKHFDDLKNIIVETLDYSCELKIDNGRFKADQVYTEFISQLEKCNNIRKEELRQLPNNFQRDVVITFNYEVMLDFAIRAAGRAPEYCLKSPGPHPDHFKLLKLHGSTNWATCKECGDDRLQEVPAYPLAEGRSFLDPMIMKSARFRMVTSVLSETKCKKCEKTDVLEPFLIPPTWSKSIEKSPILNVWKTAVEEIRDAFQIVVIGYSMPSTDTFFQYLLTLGLLSNPKLHRVIVVDKDNSDAFRARYEKVFSRSLKDRGRLIFLEQRGTENMGDFKNFIHFDKVNNFVGAL